MAEPLVVVGAGGFGRETLDVVEAMNRVGAHPRWDVIGVADDSPSEVNLARLARRAIDYLGPVASLERRAVVALGVGSPFARAALDAELSGQGFDFATLVHPAAVIGSQVSLCEGAVICAGASLGTNVSLGRQVHLNPHAVIGHDTHVGDFVSVNPNATVSGECAVEAGALIGAGSVIVQGLRIGADAVVGASACVVTDVAPRTTVVGVPARERINR